MTTHHRPHHPILVLALLILVAPAPASGAVMVPTDFVHETLVSGLDLPTAMAFLPDGRLLVAEQTTGRVRVVVQGRLAATDPALTVSNLTVGYERGLQGIAVDPAWPARPYLYAYFTHAGARCVVVRYTGRGALHAPAGEDLAFDTPVTLIGDIPDQDPNHNAGCLRFGIDGHLYVSLGDDQEHCAAIDSTSLRGQILRIDVSRVPATLVGAAPRELITPPGNPLATDDPNARLVWAYGLRNPWRFHLDPATGIAYVADVGEEDFEEVNEVRGGDYLGWPYREAHRLLPRNDCPEPGGDGGTAWVRPIVTFAHLPDLTAITVAGVYRPVPGAGSNWPASYSGDLFYGEYYTGILRRITPAGGAWIPRHTPGQPDALDWATGLVHMADFQIGPDGSLWLVRQYDDAELSGTVERIRYAGSGTTDTATVVGLAGVFAGSDHVRLEWQVAPATRPATVYRRVLDGACAGGCTWEPQAVVQPDGAGRVTYDDRAVAAGGRYSYRLGIVVGGIERFYGAIDVTVPAASRLAVRSLQARESGGTLWLSFSTPASGTVRLELFDVAGRSALARDLGWFEAGDQIIPLSGVDLGSGVYVARLTQGGRQASGKVAVPR